MMDGAMVGVGVKYQGDSIRQNGMRMIHEAEEGWVVGKLKSRVVCRLKIDLISG